MLSPMTLQLALALACTLGPCLCSIVNTNPSSHPCKPLGSLCTAPPPPPPPPPSCLLLLLPRAPSCLLPYLPVPAVRPPACPCLLQPAPAQHKTCTASAGVQPLNRSCLRWHSSILQEAVLTARQMARCICLPYRGFSCTTLLLVLIS